MFGPAFFDRPVRSELLSFHLRQKGVINPGTERILANLASPAIELTLGKLASFDF
jgi:hypothetical protein